MKSKKSYFNKTIFWKNVTLYWPIWSIYSLFILGGMPFMLWFTYQLHFQIPTQEAILRDVASAISPGYYIVVIACGALASGLVLFKYLYKSQSANMIHSFPVDRRELFFTNVISGLCFLIVPLIAGFLSGVGVCLSEGVYCVEYLFFWLIIMILTAFIAFSIVTFCAFLTGNMVGLTAGAFIFNFVVYAFVGIIRLMVNEYSFGVSSGSMFASEIGDWFSPIVNYLIRVQLVYDRDAAYNIIGLRYTGWECILIYFVMAIGLYALAFLLYKKRNIEHASDFITVPVLKPIFRWACGTIAGYFIMFFWKFLFGSIKILFVVPGMIALLLFFGSVFYFVAEMFIQKSFRVFGKKSMISSGIFAGILFLSFFGLMIYTEVEEKRIPKANNIESAELYMHTDLDFEGEDLEKILAVHELLMRDIDVYESHKPVDYYTDYGSYQYIRFDYQMKNGSNISRSYPIPLIPTSEELINTIEDLENDPAVLLSSLFGNNYENTSKQFIHGEVHVQYFGSGIDENGYYIHEYRVKELTYTQTKRLYEAALADAKAGTLLKYNTRYDDSLIDSQDNRYSINITYTTNGIEYDIDITFGRDCENIIAAVVTSLGLESEEDIIWRDSEIRIAHQMILEKWLGYASDAVKSFETGWMTTGISESGEERGNYQREFYVSPEQSKILYDALMKDCRAGNLLQYNFEMVGLIDGLINDSGNIYNITLFVNFNGAVEPVERTFYYGEECTSVLNALVELGFCESTKDIIWDKNVQMKHEPIIWPMPQED